MADQEKSTSIPVRINTSTYELLKQLSRERGMSITDLVSASVQAYMRDQAAAAGGVTRIEEQLMEIRTRLDQFLEIE